MCTAPLEPLDDDSVQTFPDFSGEKKKRLWTKEIERKQKDEHNHGCWYEAHEGAGTYLSAHMKLADRGKVGISSGLLKAQ